MSANFSKRFARPSAAPSGSKKSLYGWALLISLWVFISFFVAQFIIIGVVYALKWLGVDFTGIDSAVLNFTVAAIMYVLAIALVVGVPYIMRKHRTTLEDIGLFRLPEWKDILLAPAGFVIYLFISGILAYIVTRYVPGIDINQAQDVGFDNLNGRSQYILAFATLVIVAPIAEEILMRGYLYGKLRRLVPIVAAMLLTSIVFAVLHGQINVGLDVFALSLVLCSLREVTGSIWAGILLHMMKNGLAFYLLFVDPSILRTMGG